LGAKRIAKAITSHDAIGNAGRFDSYANTAVLDMLACGMIEDEILRDYPYLEKADCPQAIRTPRRLARADIALKL